MAKNFVRGNNNVRIQLGTVRGDITVTGDRIEVHGTVDDDGDATGTNIVDGEATAGIQVGNVHGNIVFD